MEEKISIPKSMPLAVGAIFGAFVASYMLGALNAEFEIGRPSSTSSIGYIFVPIYSGVAALVGVGVGYLFRVALKQRGKSNLVKKKKYFLVFLSILIATSLLARNIGVQEVVKYEEFNEPRILSNKGGFAKEPFDKGNAPSPETNVRLLWDFQKKSILPVSHGRNSAEIEVLQSVLLKIPFDEVLPITYDVSGFGYITEVSALKWSGGPKAADYLVVLIKLRATSARSILLIYDHRNILVYEELLKRCGRKQFLGLVDELEGESLIVNLCSPFKLTTEGLNNRLQPDAAKPRV